MRRSLLFFAVVALAACEDGPTQTFNPAADGAGGRWNDGRGAGSSDPATQGFNSDIGGGTKQEICPGPTKKAKWAAMLSAPIVPPRKGANIDMAGSDKWEGLTLDQAEQINCQSTNYDDGDNYWGDNGEVTFELQPKGNEVLLTVIHRRLRDRDATLRVGAGWHAHLDVLVARVKGEEPRPFWDGLNSLKKEYEQRIPAA